MSNYKGHIEDSSGNILLSIGNGMTATLETGSTASQIYVKGAYVFFDNKLCKVTQAIASGDTLEIGTNLEQTSIGAELTSHLNSSDGKEFYFDVLNDKYGFYPSASKVTEEFVPFGGTLPDPFDIPINFPSGGASNGFGIPYQFLLDNYTTFKHSQSSGAGTLNVGSVNRSAGTVYNVSSLTPQSWWGSEAKWISVYATSSFGGHLCFYQ